MWAHDRELHAFPVSSWDLGGKCAYVEVMRWQPTDYDLMAALYDEGRAMPEAWVVEWRMALEDYLSGASEPVADVGAGTGIWAWFIASWFDIDVVGVEPAQGMRQQAIRTRRHDRVSYVGGEAEQLPLRDQSCGAIWMSTVVHHVPNLDNAAKEARRVLRQGQPLLIRQGFSGRHDDILWTQAFPSALAIAEERHPRLESVIETFESAGFEHQETRRVREIAAADLHDYVRKLETRADSTLTLISDEDFERGLTELRRMAEVSPPEPVRAGLDLVVFR
jgi:SAM-dependent methyltransferase